MSKSQLKRKNVQQGKPMLHVPNVVMEGDRIWRKVIWAADCKPCDMCGEPVCPVCQEHYAECDCPGPTQDEIEYKVIDGTEYGAEIEV